MTKNLSQHHTEKPVDVQTFVSKRSAQTRSSRLYISLTASEDHQLQAVSSFSIIFVQKLCSVKMQTAKKKKKKPTMLVKVIAICFCNHTVQPWVRRSDTVAVVFASVSARTAATMRGQLITLWEI